MTEVLTISSRNHIMFGHDLLFGINNRILIINSVKICMIFGNGIVDRYSLRITLLFVLVGLSGLYVEITNAFEYAQGARKGLPHIENTSLT